jgi:uncharacterized protein (DUF1330 family)
MADEGRSKRAKSGKRYDNSDLKKAIENKTKTGSALDNLEFDDDDAVFDMLDDNEYAELVESRRNGQDFVVDDGTDKSAGS